MPGASHGVSQQTPSAQFVDWHCPADPQASPFGRATVLVTPGVAVLVGVSVTVAVAPSVAVAVGVSFGVSVGVAVGLATHMPSMHVALSANRPWTARHAVAFSMLHVDAL